MWRLRLKSVDPIAGSTGAALLCAGLTGYFHSRPAELSSEILCWLILPLIITTAKRSDAVVSSRATLSGSFRPQNTSLAAVWLVSTCLVSVSLYKQELGMIRCLPALTPLLLLAERKLHATVQVARMIDSRSPFLFFLKPAGSGLVALLASLTLADWSLSALYLSILPTAAYLVIFATVMARDPDKALSFPHLDLEDAVIPISLHVLVISTIAMMVRVAIVGFPDGGIITPLLLGLTKAMSWYFTLQTTRYTSWTIAPVFATFGMFSSMDPSLLPSDVQALAYCFLACITLGQVIHMLPRQAKARTILWIFSLMFIVPYLGNIMAIWNARKLAPDDFGPHQHPVEALITRAKTEFDAISQRQSKNLTAAQDEYRRRYGLDPPPGFDSWYKFAVSHESPIIDEFDTIHHSVSPFFKLSGLEFRNTINDGYNLVGGELWLCSLSGHTAKAECRHPYRSFDRHISLLVNQLFKDLPGHLPDVSFLFNHLDEPRVLLPPRPAKGAYSSDRRQVRITNLSRRPTFDVVTKFCPRLQDDKPSIKNTDVETFGLPFVTDRNAVMDLCQHPEYANMHGLFMSPSSFPLIEGLVPVLSTGAASTTGDILFPTPAYMEPEFLFNKSRDIPWKDKKNIVYWAGSTTGGYAHNNDQWPLFQRQRFVAFVQKLKRQTYYYLREQGGQIRRGATSFLNGRLYDVAFTRYLHCDRKYCHAQSLYFRTKSWADKDAPLKSRLVFDLDGNGVSGRYYKLLASRSAPLKQTLLREWHDDRLLPWVHYIPVSQSMEELPELVFYLTSTEAGQQRAEEIAEQGREWYKRAFREIDLTIYAYRLMLELARLQDPEREAS